MLEIVSRIYNPSAAVRAAKMLEAHYPPHVLAYAQRHGIRVVPLGRSVSFCQASPRLKELAPHIDTWPTPPAGLFVVQERTAYIRQMSALSVCHEFAHGLDLALGGGESYLSSSDTDIRSAFSQAAAFVTPYAATAPDEFFAESVRAYVAANDRRSPWPAVSPERLYEIDARMYGIVERLFEGMARAVSGEQLMLTLGGLA